MQTREFKCAIFGRANSREMSGWVAAELVTRGSRPGRRRKLWRIVGLSLGYLTAAGLVVALAPTRARAEEAGAGVHNEIEALEAKVRSLQATVSEMQGQISSLQSQLAAIQSNPALALGPFVRVDPNSENEVGWAKYHL